jgi:hypothetical protein
MYSVTRAFHEKQETRDSRPLLLLFFVNKHGTRLWSDITPGEEMSGSREIHLADGSWLADGTVYAGLGSAALLAAESRVLDFGDLRESLLPLEESLQASSGMAERAQYKVVLDNSDSEIARIAAVENVLDAYGELRIGWPGLWGGDFMTRFRGKCLSYKFGRTSATLDFQAV